MVFLEAMAAQQWINDHPGVVRKLRRDIRKQALEEAYRIVNRHSQACRDEGIPVALRIREDILALKNSSAEFSTMEEADKFACIYNDSKRKRHEWYYGQPGYPDDVAVCRHCGITAKEDE